MQPNTLTWRATTLAVVTTVLLGVTSVVGAPAHAGQVGVTISITGAGRVLVVEGTPADGASGVCNADANKLNPTATTTCGRIRSEAAFEAWLWLRPVPLSDAGGAWSIRADGWSGCDETRLRQGVTECGVHSGAFSSDERSPRIVFVDRVAPVVSPVSAAVSTITDRTATFSFATNEPGSTRCRVDGEPLWEPCTSPVTRTFATDGLHQLDVQASDLSRNQGAVSSGTVTLVDTVLEQVPPATTSSRTATFTFTSGGSAAFQCRLDGGDVINCGAGRRITWVFTDLPDGQHTLAVQGRDGAVIDPVPATYSWVVDNLAPETVITRALVDGGSARFEVSSPGASSLSCRLTRDGVGGSWVPCTNPPTFTGLTPAAYTVEIRGTDPAGNTDQSPARHTWTVSGPTGPTTPGDPGTPGTPDRTPPDTVLTEAPGHGSWLLADRTTVGYRSTEALSSWRCTLDGVARPCRGGSTELRHLKAGSHVFTVAAVDRSGNVDPTPATRTWTVPLTSAALAHGRGWTQRRAPVAYGSAWATTRRRGAVLSTSVRRARSIVLVATTGRRQGAVRVYAGRRLLRTVHLAARTTRHRQVRVVTASTAPFTGRLRIVAASGRQVRIEGLGVR